MAEKILIEFEVTSDGAVRDIRQVGTAVDGIAPSAATAAAGVGNLKSAILAAGAVAAASKVAGWLKDAAAEAIESQRVFTQLGSTVSNVGVYWRDAAPQVAELTKRMQDMSRVGDEEAAQTLNTLIGLTRDYHASVSLLPSVIDASIGSGKGLGEVTEAVGKAMTGQAKGLQLLVGKLDEGTKATIENGTAAEKTAAIAKLLNDRWGGAAQKDLATYSGQIKQLSNYYGELKELAGGALLKAAAGTTDLSEATKGLGGSLTTVSNALDIAVGGFVTWKEWFVDNIPIVRAAKEGLSGLAAVLNGELRDALVGAGDTAEETDRQLQNLNGEVSAASAAYLTAEDAVKKSSAALKDWGDEVEAAAEDAAKAAREAAAALDSAAAASGRAAARIKELKALAAEGDALSSAAPDGVDTTYEPVNYLPDPDDPEHLADIAEWAQKEGARTAKELQDAVDKWDLDFERGFGGLTDALGDSIYLAMTGRSDEIVDAWGDMMARISEESLGSLENMFMGAFRSSGTGQGTFWATLGANFTDSQGNFDPMSQGSRNVAGAVGGYLTSTSTGQYQQDSNALGMFGGGALSGWQMGGPLGAIFGAAMAGMAWEDLPIREDANFGFNPAAIFDYNRPAGIDFNPTGGSSLTPMGGFDSPSSNNLSGQAEIQFFQERWSEFWAEGRTQRAVLRAFGDPDLFDSLEMQAAFDSLSENFGQISNEELAGVLRGSAFPEAWRQAFGGAFQEGMADLWREVYGLAFTSVEASRLALTDNPTIDAAAAADRYTPSSELTDFGQFWQQVQIELALLPSEERMASLLTVIRALTTIRDLREVDPLAEVDMSSADQFRRFMGDASEQVDLLTAGWDGMTLLDRAADLEQIGEVWRTVLTSAIQHLAQLKAAQDQLNDSFGSAREQNALSGMSSREQEAYLRAQITGGMGDLAGADSVEDVMRIAGDLQGYIQALSAILAANDAALVSIRATMGQLDELASADITAGIAQTAMAAWQDTIGAAGDSVAELGTGLDDLSLPDIADRLTEIGATWTEVLDGARQMLESIAQAQAQVDDSFRGAREELWTSQMTPNELQSYLGGRIAGTQSEIRNATSPEQVTAATGNLLGYISQLQQVLMAGVAEMEAAGAQILGLANNTAVMDLSMTGPQRFAQLMDEAYAAVNAAQEDVAEGLDDMSLSDRAADLREIGALWQDVLNETLRQIQEIDSAQAQIDTSFGRAIEQLQLSGMSEREQASYFQNAISGLMGQIGTAETGGEVADISAQILDYIGQLQETGVLSDAQILALMEQAQAAATGQLGGLRDTATENLATFEAAATAAATALGAFETAALSTDVFQQIDDLLVESHALATAQLDTMRDEVLAAVEDFAARAGVAADALYREVKEFGLGARQTVEAMLAAAQELANDQLDALRQEVLDGLAAFEDQVVAATLAMSDMTSAAAAWGTEISLDKPVFAPHPGDPGGPPLPPGTEDPILDPFGGGGGGSGGGGNDDPEHNPTDPVVLWDDDDNFDWNHGGKSLSVNVETTNDLLRQVLAALAAQKPPAVSLAVTNVASPGIKLETMPAQFAIG